MTIFGINPVLEALKARRVVRLRIAARRDKRIDEIVHHANGQKIPIERVDQLALDRLARGGVHQGVIADVEDARDYSIQDLLSPPSAALRPPQGQAPITLTTTRFFRCPSNSA